MKTSTAVEISDNSKIGKVSATYATQRTCPSSCPFQSSGCYAEKGHTAFTTRRLNKAADESPLAIAEYAREEAAHINTLSGKLPLRLHVVGDATTDEAAKMLSDAAANHTSKYSQIVWTYTHAFEDVARASWGNVSVLASCETTSKVKLAHSRGYAAAVVVSKFKQTSAYVEDGVKLIPCPVQTGKAETCSTCQLCWKAPALLAGKAAIAFEPDGGTAPKIQAVLTQITL